MFSKYHRRTNYIKAACLITVAIFAMAYFGRTVQKLAKPLLDSQAFLFSSILIFVVGLFTYYHLFLRLYGLPRLVAHSSCCLLVTLLCLENLRLPIERFHLFEYALLAAMILGAQSGNSVFRAGIISWIIGSCIGISDELVQAISPDRICDPRDMAINSASVLLGVLIAGPLKKLVSHGQS